MKWHLCTRAPCALLIAALSACSVGPAYKKPDVPPPTAWHEAPAPAADAAVWPQSDWWHGFGSPQLDELIGAAQTGNDDLAGAIARVQEADAQVRIAGAPLFPSIDGGADATR